MRTQLITKGAKLSFTYTNWRGVTEERQVIFEELMFGKYEYFKEEEIFVLCGYDLNRAASRKYAMKDISNLKVIK